MATIRQNSMSEPQTEKRFWIIFQSINNVKWTSNEGTILASIKIRIRNVKSVLVRMRYIACSKRDQAAHTQLDWTHFS